MIARIHRFLPKTLMLFIGIRMEYKPSAEVAENINYEHACHGVIHNCGLCKMHTHYDVCLCYRNRKVASCKF